MLSWFIISVSLFFFALLTFVILRLIYKKYLCEYFRLEMEILERELFLFGFSLNPKYLSMIAYFGFLVKPSIRLYRRRRERIIENQLPDALILISNAIKAGLALSQAIEIAAEEVKDPIKYELGLIVESLCSGNSVDRALKSFEVRVRSKDVSIFVQSIEVLRRAGGNLVETLSLLAETIDERRRVARKNDAAVAQGKYQSYTLLVMPWAIGLMLWIIAPDYIDPLVSTRLGCFFIASGVILEVLGSVWMIRTVRIKV